MLAKGCGCDEGERDRGSELRSGMGTSKLDECATGRKTNAYGVANRREVEL